MNRRDFIKIASLGMAGTMMPLSLLRSESEILSPEFFTPNDKFYITSIGSSPTVKLDSWKLRLGGLVQKPTAFGYADLLSFEKVATSRTLICIGNKVGGDQIGNASWSGVRLKDVLEKAGLKAGATKVIFRCADGYHTAIPVADALNEDAVLAFRMNGDVLPIDHGYPLRLLNPGHYGMKCPKWIVNIEPTNRDHVGYWEKQNWSDAAWVNLLSQIRDPSDGETIRGDVYAISGLAFDGGNGGGVAKVEVSTDDGQTWNQAEVWKYESPLAWSLWKYNWRISEAEKGKSLKLKVKATNRHGEVQDEKRVSAYPDGASGIHSIKVKVAST